MALFLLYESASGYALFERAESEQIGAMTPEVIATQTDLARFSKLVRMKAFVPFVSAEQALENQNDISEGILNETLRGFLEHNLDKAKPGKLTKYSLGVTDVKIGQAVQEEMSIKCVNDELVLELMRYVEISLSRVWCDSRAHERGPHVLWCLGPVAFDSTCRTLLADSRLATWKRLSLVWHTPTLAPR